MAEPFPTYRVPARCRYCNADYTTLSFFADPTTRSGLCDACHEVDARHQKALQTLPADRVAQRAKQVELTRPQRTWDEEDDT